MGQNESVKQDVKIKSWLYRKNGWNGRVITALPNRIVKETDKAVLVEFQFNKIWDNGMWVPKSCLIDEWEPIPKDTSNFGYHNYLEGVYHRAYADGIIPNYTIKSGPNHYPGDAFVHQLKTVELKKALKKYSVSYMSREEWNNRQEAQ